MVGGAEVVFVCHHGRTATDKCIMDFEDQEGVTFVDAEPDGNCFFHTLAMYYGFKYTNQSTIHEDLHTEFRQHVVTYMLAHYENYAILGVSKEEIEEMREDGMWNSDAVMPPQQPSPSISTFNSMTSYQERGILIPKRGFYSIITLKRARFQMIPSMFCESIRDIMVYCYRCYKRRR